MPTFGSPFSGLANSRKLTEAELVRAVRFMVASEYEVTQLYMQLAVAVPKDIADEEREGAAEAAEVLIALGARSIRITKTGIC